MKIDHTNQLDESPTLNLNEFAELYENARPTLRIVAAAECNFDLADDIVSQASIIAMNQLNSFIPGTNFTAWTAAIVRGVARNQRRSEQRRLNRITKLFYTGSAYNTPSNTPSNTPINSPHSPASEHAQLQSTEDGPSVQLPPDFDPKLREALKELSAPQRTCLLLRTILEHSYNEIAEILSIPSATARSHVYRARTILLNQLQSDFNTTTTGADHDA
ncbi:MAG: RNA polymerase sigma factor [Phycisphaerales bacterium]